MTTHLIDMLLGGGLDPERDLDLAAMLPLKLHQVEPANAYAPDYRIDGSDHIDIGYGWSKTASKSGIPYLAIILQLPQGRQVSGVAWQSPERDGRWLAQFQSETTVTLHS